MSQMYMEQEFSLAQPGQAAKIRQFILDSLYSENANPEVHQWSDEAVLYTRSNWSIISDRLQDDGIELSSEQEVALINFSSEYASIVDDEEDMAEIIQLRKEGVKDE